MKSFKEFLLEISQFKRDEIAHELRGEGDKLKLAKHETHHVMINGKIWHKDGRPVQFDSADHAGAVAAKLRMKGVKAEPHVKSSWQYK